MVRNLMMILGPCLMLAAFGCSDDETGTGGTGGSGGSTTPTDACTNAADTAFICDDAFDPGACGTEGGGQADATSACLQEDPGLSADCADCYGETTQCTFDNCLGQDSGNCAVDPEGDDCVACRADNCTPAFDACRGTINCGTGGTGGNGGGGGAAGNGGSGNG